MRIVMTGATAGIGFEAAKRLMVHDNTALIVAARAPETAPRPLKDGAELHAADLADLASVRSLAEALAAGPPIDALVLNAGLQCVSRRNSADGYELTFAVNHLAHYLLLRLLLPNLAPSARVVLTASGTHDPAEGAPLPPPRHAQVEFLAHPERDPEHDKRPYDAGRRAYTSSKLCNVMTARELARRTATARPDLAIASFCPGFTPGTGLARNYPWPVGPLFKFLGPLILRRGPGVSTPPLSGGLLATLVTSPDYAASRGDYYAVRGGKLIEKTPSELARNDSAAAALWNDSAALLHLPED